MPIIVKIGYQEFLVPTEKRAVAVISALAAAMRMDHVYRDGQYYYYPADPNQRGTEIAMVQVPAHSILDRKPEEG